MIGGIRHYIKIRVSLQAETKSKKILTSLQTSVTILFYWIKTKQGDLHVSYSPSTHRSIRETESLNIRLSIGTISIISIPRDGGLMQTT